MLKDCRTNPNACHLKQLGCYNNSFSGNWKNCNDLFTYNFKALCKNYEEGGVFQYDLTTTSGVPSWACTDPITCAAAPNATYNYYIVDIKASCDEEEE